LPPDEAREPTGRQRLQARPGGGGTDKLEHLHRVRQPLDRDGTQRLDLDKPCGQPQGLPRGEHRTGLRHLLQARRQVGGLAYRRIVHVQAAVNRPHHHGPSIESDADLHRHPMGALYLVAIVSHSLLHAQRRVAGAHGMVFMGNGGPEEGHNAIPHHLVDGAFVAVYSLDHALQDRVEQLAGLLGVALRQQFHGSLQVRK
jgi:hypothetical protein